MVLYTEIDMPGHAASWGMADSQIVASCPSYASNVNNIPLNPANNLTYTYIEGVLKELLTQGPFQNQTFTFQNMIHLGGDEMVAGCWTQDASIKQYMTKNNLTTAQLWNEFQQKVNAIINTINPNAYKVYWEDALANGNTFGGNSIINFWSSTNKTNALNKGYKVIQSTYWYLD